MKPEVQQCNYYNWFDKDGMQQYLISNFGKKKTEAFYEFLCEMCQLRNDSYVRINPDHWMDEYSQKNYPHLQEIFQFIIDEFPDTSDPLILWFCW